MHYKNNGLIKAFSSVELALLLISSIAVTSIAGTIVPQGESIQFYTERFGEKLAIVLELLNITNMYSSYWFQGLLILLCLNLIICTWVRLPGVLAVIRKDSLKSAPRDIDDAGAVILSSGQSLSTLQAETISSALSSFSPRKAEGIDGEFLFLYEKGAWSRSGAYIVHISILLIVCGALVGKYFGYDAFVMVPEGSSEASVHQRGGEHATIPLGFEIFCRNFVTEYYANGTPREYRSDLEILDSEKKVLSKSITVNNPLKYKGLTFFQSSYQPMENEYKLMVTKKKRSAPEGAEASKIFFLRPSTEQKASELGTSFKILETSSDGHGHGPYKLQFDDKDASPLVLTLDDREVFSIERSEAVYTISLAQRFATGLKVVKDPGVWIVYLGCGLMLFGLYISFFMSHVRVWIACRRSGAGMKISIAGATNKNFIKLEQIKEKIVESLLSEETLALRRG